MNQRGDAMLILVLALAVVAGILIMSTVSQAVTQVRAQVTAMKQEASFYNGEVAALLAYLQNSANSSPPLGTTNLVLPNSITGP